jgi:putative flippase GtrA
MLLVLLNKIPWYRLIKFSIIGGSALVIDIGIYIFLTRIEHIQYIISRLISLSIAIFWNFNLNRHWTFQAVSEKVNRQFVKFLIVIISTSLLSLILMKIGVSVLHIYDLLVIIIVSFLILLINFFAHYFWSYANKDN